MTSIPQCVLSILVGLAIAAYGLAHAVAGYPGPDVFARLAADLPALAAVLAFALAVLAAVVGLVLLIVAARRLRRRWQQARRRVPPGPAAGRGYRDNGYPAYHDPGGGGYATADEWDRPVAYR